MINGNYAPYPAQYSPYSVPSYPIQPRNPEPDLGSQLTYSQPAIPQAQNPYQKELERLKKDKKYSDFYIVATASIGILGAAIAFIAKKKPYVQI
jgi:hypothetical protein